MIRWGPVYLVPTRIANESKKKQMRGQKMQIEDGREGEILDDIIHCCRCYFVVLVEGEKGEPDSKE